VTAGADSADDRPACCDGVINKLLTRQYNARRGQVSGAGRRRFKEQCRNGQRSNGHGSNGHGSNGHGSNGQRSNGQRSNGHGTTGRGRVIRPQGGRGSERAY
jgi:hypothetical protein